MSNLTPEARARKAAYRKAYHVAHREEDVARNKAYYTAHRDEIRARVKGHKATPEARARKAAKATTPEARARRAAYDKTHRESRRAANQVRYYAHLEEARAYGRAYYAAHKEKLSAAQKIFRLQAKYGLSPMARDALLEKQGGVCAVCGTARWNGSGPHVDHDHATGKVRGILCSTCNTALGMIKDDPGIARAMADYLEARITGEGK